MIVGSYDKSDRADYDPKQGKSTYSIEIDGDFLDDILKADPTIAPRHGGTIR